ncbi:hypothetical protein [Nostoc sp. UHCC 0251]|uniref:hypothetical protein n=1 Tax=Nostoc sp. UHCC 0251 TaxID=3110240 RepID=UPI002B2034B6|nr:hypothetical protein [Nostoc sp. UHCC 0251]MEA5621398.1 hypothetical protein [Nostoc sp. UHCC 0251]
MDTPILDRLIEELKVMPEDLQYRVLEFARQKLGEYAEINIQENRVGWVQH